ncbi:hypothetical protein D3C81_1824090 [compost metagenome]
MLSRTIDIIIVDRIVIAAPLTIPIILKTSVSGTIPIKNTHTAEIAVGTHSLIPRGLHSINTTVIANIESMMTTCRLFMVLLSRIH